MRVGADVKGAPQRGLYDPLHYVILDDAGRASNACMAEPRWSDASKSQLVMQCDTPYFPRRSAHFRLQILRRRANEYTPVGEFTLPNPVARRFGSGNPNPFPPPERLATSSSPCLSSKFIMEGRVVNRTNGPRALYTPKHDLV